VTERDLPIFIDHQRDPEADRMAAFRARDRDAFMERRRSAMIAVGRTVSIREAG
jgi:hypothetical protein